MATLAPTLSGNAGLSFERPTAAVTTSAGATLNALGNIFGSLSLQAETVQPRELTQDEQFGQLITQYDEQNPGVLDPENPNFRNNLRRLMPELLRVAPHLTTEIVNYGNAYGVEAVSPVQRLEDAQEDTFISWLTENPIGVAEEMRIRAQSTDANGQLDQAAYNANLAQARADFVATEAAVADLEQRASLIEGSANIMEQEQRLSNMAWDAAKLLARREGNLYLDGFAEIADEIRSNPGGTAYLDPEVAASLGLRSTEVTAQTFSNVLLRAQQAIRNNITNQIMSDPALGQYAQYSPPEEFWNDVLGPLQILTNQVNAEWGTQSQILANTNARNQMDNYALLPPDMQRLVDLTHMLPEQLLVHIQSDLLGADFGQRVRDLLISSFSVDAPIEEIASFVGGMSAADRQAAQTVTASTLSSGMASGLNLRNAFTQFATTHQMDNPDGYLDSVGTFHQLIGQNAAELSRLAAEDPSFATQVQNFVGSDLSVTLEEAKSQVANYGVLSLSLNENGELTLVPNQEEINRRVAEYTYANNGVPPDEQVLANWLGGFRNVEEFLAGNPELGSLVNLYNGKVRGTSQLGDVGGTVIEAIRANNASLNGEAADFYDVVNDAIAAATGTNLPAVTATTTASSYPTSVELPESVRQDTEFLAAVDAMAADFNFPAEALLQVMHFETSGSFNPSIRPRRPDGSLISSATGLIQFLESTARRLGTSTAELEKMTRVEQMEYVRRYLEPFKGRLHNFGDIYMAIHYPAAVGKPDDYVLYREGSDEYNGNKSLDTNKDGIVTRGEAVARAAGSTGIAAGGQVMTGDEIRALPTPLAPATDVLRPVERPASVEMQAGTQGSVAVVEGAEQLPVESVGANPSSQVATESGTAASQQGNEEALNQIRSLMSTSGLTVEDLRAAGIIQ